MYMSISQIISGIRLGNICANTFLYSSLNFVFCVPINQWEVFSGLMPVCWCALLNAD